MSFLGVLRYNLHNEILWCLPKKVTHSYLYKKSFGKKLDLENPKNFNEKLQYLIVNKYGIKEGRLADKYLVKEYVENLRIEGLNVAKTLKIYNNANDIDLSELPKKFVLKCNHGSGNVFVCTDKEKFDFENAKKVLNSSLKQCFAKHTFEYHYKYIKPVIMAEEYLDDNTGKNPLDYKFYVFNGKCDRMLLCSERDKSLRLDDFDLEWKKIDDTLPKYKSQKDIEKPKNFENMVRIAEELCIKDGKVDIPFARVDLYDLNGKIYFGEYTFTPACGLIDYYNEKTLMELGEKLDLSKY
ncbi:MAG: glycosyl transferase [Clostridia bacterium]|nr:glycosyl transferase [Clostridia bacterium]